MSKETPANPVLAFTPEQFQEMMKTLFAEQMKAQAAQNLQMIKDHIAESRKPTDKELAAIENAKQTAQYWKELEKAQNYTKDVRQNACTHMHPHAGRTHFFRFEVVYPQGATLLVCSRCDKRVTNFEGDKLVSNPEFNKWIVVPSIADGGFTGIYG